MTRTVVGSFDGYKAAQRAAQALLEDGFREEELSVVASTLAGEFKPEALPGGDTLRIRPPAR